MAVKQIELVNFRSYESKKFAIEPNLTLVIGRNGSGKTNLLESVHVAATTRSWRTNDRHLIKHGQANYQIKVGLSKTDLLVAYDQPANKKQLSLNHRKVAIERYIGHLNVVLFEPQTLELLTGNPEGRRRWLNSVLAYSNKQYWRDLGRYRRVLKQRNSLLKSRQANIKSQIFAWDVPLVELATKLFVSRQKLIDFINQRLPDLYQSIAGAPVNIELIYQTPIRADNYSSDLMAKLTSGLTNDIRLGSTSYGPHRDDVAALFKSQPIARIGSRGEHRSVVLATKLIELDWRKLSNKNELVLLLDDVFSELDQKRRQFLLTKLKGIQTIITSTDKHGLGAKLPPHQLIKL